MSKSAEQLLADLKDQLMRAERQGNDAFAAQLRISVEMQQRIVNQLTGQTNQAIQTAADAYIIRESKSLVLVSEAEKQQQTVEDRVRQEQAAKLAEAISKDGSVSNTVTTYINNGKSAIGDGVTSVSTESLAEFRAAQAQLDYLTRLIQDDITTNQGASGVTNYNITQTVASESSGIIGSVITGLGNIGKYLVGSITTLAEDTLSGIISLADKVRSGIAAIASSIAEGFADWLGCLVLGFADYLMMYAANSTVTEAQMVEAMESQIRVAETVTERMQLSKLQEKFG